MKVNYISIWPTMSDINVSHENQTFTLTIPDEKLKEVWLLVEAVAEEELKKLFDKPVTVESRVTLLEGPTIEHTDEIPF